MMRFLLILLFPVSLAAQQSNILLLQKNHRSIRQFFPGTTISFFTTEHMGVSAVIDYIERDSLFLLQYDVKMVLNIFGTFSPDTLAVYKLNFSLKNIYSFPADPRKFAFITNGSLFMLGGGAYLVLNIVNTLREGDAPFGKNNIPKIVGGVTAFAFGFLLHKTQVTEYRLGRKYKLKYLPAGEGSGGK